MFGGEGNDVLNGNNGIDRLEGGDGSDTFVFWTGGDKDEVLDFEDNVDKIKFNGFDISGVQAALDVAVEAGGHVLFDFGLGDELTVRNTTIALLSDDILVG